MNVTDVMTQVIESNKAAMAPFNTLAEITQRAYTKSAEQQMAVARDYMEFGSKSVEAISKTQGPQELFNQQIAIAKEMGEKAVANAEAFTKLATETQEELKAWAEDAVKSAEVVVMKTEAKKPAAKTKKAA